MKELCVDNVYLWRVLGFLIYSLKVLIPLILIFQGIKSCVRVSIAKEPNAKKEFEKLFYNLLAGLLVFLTPSVIHSIFEMLVDMDNSSFLVCESCLYSPSGSVCNSAVDEYKSNREKSKIKDDDEHLKGGSVNSDNLPGGMGGTVADGISNTKPEYVGDDHFVMKIGQRTYQVFGQNESAIGSVTLRDGRSFSTGGVGPTTLASALSAYGYKGGPVEVNRAGSDVSAESHYKAIKTLQKQGKLSSSVKAKVHSKSSLPNNYEDYYKEIRKAIMAGHDIVIDMREGSKEGQNYCNVYGTGDYFQNEGAIHAHWVTLTGYDTANDKVFVANSCGTRQWFSLSTMLSLTYQAVSGEVFSDEGGWVGSYVEIWK